MLIARNYILFCLALLLFASCTQEPVSSTKQENYFKYNKQELVRELQKLDLSTYDAALQAAITAGTYQPIFSEESVIDIDSLTKEDHGLGNYFAREKQALQIMLDSLNTMSFVDSIPASTLVQKELQLRNISTKYHKAIKFGVVDPKQIYERGFYAPSKTADSAWLAKQYTNPDYLSSLLAAAPENINYKPLREAYIQFKTSPDSTWQELPALPKRKIELGDKYSGAPLLRERFNLAPVADTLPYHLIIDSTLVNGIKAFQSSYGLNADGVIGPATLGILNTSPQELRKKVEATLERFRWNYDLQYDSLLLANIAEYKLHVFEGGSKVQEHRVCVGIAADDYKTPEFMDTLESVVVNPKWYVPRSIASKEILFDQMADSTYATRNNYTVYHQGQSVDPTTINWSSYTPDDMPYSFVQDSGGGNALGRVKFLFPNRYSIYFHDTPSKRFFKKDNRAVSHGCVRLDEPFKLADFILGNNENYLEAKESDDRVKFNSPKRYPVLITYYTAWANEDGSIQFRNDVYKKDNALIAELEKLTN